MPPRGAREWVGKKGRPPGAASKRTGEGSRPSTPCLLVHAHLFAPARVQGVGIAREGFKRARELLVLLGELDRIGTSLPALVGLAQRDRAGSRGVDMAVGATARGVDHVA